MNLSQISLNILDCLFYEGHDVIFSFALSLFQIAQNKIYETQEGENIADVIRDALHEWTTPLNKVKFNIYYFFLLWFKIL